MTEEKPFFVLPSITISTATAHHCLRTSKRDKKTDIYKHTDGSKGDKSTLNRYNFILFDKSQQFSGTLFRSSRRKGGVERYAWLKQGSAPLSIENRGKQPQVSWWRLANYVMH